MLYRYKLFLMDEELAIWELKASPVLQNIFKVIKQYLSLLPQSIAKYIFLVGILFPLMYLQSGV
jgi:hypothetical protein